MVRFEIFHLSMTAVGPSRLQAESRGNGTEIVEQKPDEVIHPDVYMRPLGPDHEQIGGK